MYVTLMVFTTIKLVRDRINYLQPSNLIASHRTGYILINDTQHKGIDRKKQKKRGGGQ